jgi:uncharacterized membrane protein YkgB
MNRKLNKLDKKITCWMRDHGVRYLRYSLAIVFIWFGLLKPLGWSPASGLVANTVYLLNPSWFVPFLGWWEVLIGVCLLRRSWIRVGIFLMAIQMVGTFLPLVLLPEVTWTGFMTLTLEGQYIIKNLVLISAALVVGSHVRDGKC